MTTVDGSKSGGNPTGRTSYERAAREYDVEFQHVLTSKIIEAVTQASIISDPDLQVMMLRVGETTEALLECLILFASMSPIFDTPSRLREFAERVGKKIRRQVARARAEGVAQDFVVGAQRDAGQA
jgi:hypothetical protein